MVEQLVNKDSVYVKKIESTLQELGYMVTRVIKKSRFAPDLVYTHNGITHIIKAIPLDGVLTSKDILPYTSLSGYISHFAPTSPCLVSRGTYSPCAYALAKSRGITLQTLV